MSPNEHRKAKTATRRGSASPIICNKLPRLVRAGMVNSAKTGASNMPNVPRDMKSPAIQSKIFVTGSGEAASQLYKKITFPSRVISPVIARNHFMKRRRGLTHGGGGGGGSADAVTGGGGKITSLPGTRSLRGEACWCRCSLVSMVVSNNAVNAKPRQEHCKIGHYTQNGHPTAD